MSGYGGDMNGQALTLTSDWLNCDYKAPAATATTLTVGNTTFGGLTGGLAGTYYPTCPTYYYWTSPAPRPIKLTMSEVDRLRKAAKADDKIKAILAKFTDQIEIVVDFD